MTELAAKMNQLVGEHLIDAARLQRDRSSTRPPGAQRARARTRRWWRSAAARRFLGDRLMRVASPHELLDPARPGAGQAGSGGPLVAVRLHVLTRKTLGGLETDLDGPGAAADGSPLPGVYAVGEAAGFGGGGMHGYRALEGTFLGGCLFTGRDRALAGACSRRSPGLTAALQGRGPCSGRATRAELVACRTGGAGPPRQPRR